MTPERWQRIKKILAAALERQPLERPAYLDEACGDPSVRQEVESLIAAHDQEDNFVEQPFVEQSAVENRWLQNGTKLGPYEIVAPLGRGGMGDVYQAIDDRLGRNVAIKVLTAAFVDAPQQLSRFQREARMLAALNHPNIAMIYGLEESDGLHFLVMELVLGQTLAEQLRAGPLGLNEALEIGVQIAAGLEAAHEKGFVHRDLKPSNVKVTPEGRVKVLDFGLAKAFAYEAGRDLSDGPTPPTATQEGMILGTPAYMSPEQARGKRVDKRTDIWAFGCVLYELLTARQAFGGETLGDTIALVLEREPDWQALPPSTPDKVREVLHRCLRKDPQQRLRDVGDARIQLEELRRYGSDANPLASARTAQGGPVDSAQVLTPSTDVKGTARDANARHRLWWRIGWGICNLLAFAGFILAYHYTLEVREPVHAVRLDILPPDGTTIGALAVSPDGQRLAFVALKSGRGQLWVRGLETPEGQRLAGTEGATHPFWSPDSLQIGFFADGKVKKISASGGSPQTLADAPGGLGGTWNEDGVIVFAPSFDTPLYRVAATGGTSEAATLLDISNGEISHRWPHFLPGGRRLLYFALNSLPAGTSPGSAGTLFVGSLEGKTKKSLVTGAYGATFAAPGYILFARGTSLLAQRFHPETLELDAKDAITLANGIGVEQGLEGPAFSASASRGILVYRRGATIPGGGRELRWYSRDGQSLGSVGSAERYWSARISPDGQSAAVEIEDSQTRASNIWIYDLARPVRRRFTFSQTPDNGPVWSPSGRSIVFSSRNPGQHLSLYVKSSGGAGQEQPLLQTQGDVFAEDWSRDGRFLLYSQFDPAVKPGSSLWVLPMQGDRKPYPLFRSLADDKYPHFSPNGRWVAYRSNESGRNQIYVIPFQGSGGKWQVSLAGGEWPVWRADGRELYYVSPDRELMAVAVHEGASTFEFDAPRRLFQASILGGYGERYGVSADGRRFLVLVQKEEGPLPLTLVMNWSADLP